GSVNFPWTHSSFLESGVFLASRAGWGNSSGPRQVPAFCLSDRGLRPAEQGRGAEARALPATTGTTVTPLQPARAARPNRVFDREGLIMGPQALITERPNGRSDDPPAGARPRRILVVGGTGMLGQPVVRRLLADGYPVRVLSRAPDRARALLGEG